MARKMEGWKEGRGEGKSRYKEGRRGRLGRRKVWGGREGEWGNERVLQQRGKFFPPYLLHALYEMRGWLLNLEDIEPLSNVLLIRFELRELGPHARYELHSPSNRDTISKRTIGVKLVHESGNSLFEVLRRVQKASAELFLVLLEHSLAVYETLLKRHPVSLESLQLEVHFIWDCHFILSEDVELVVEWLELSLNARDA